MRIVTIADMQVSSDTTEWLVTYALGSCLGVAAYDPVARVGGLLHVMLPASSLHPQKAQENPSMFVDTGVPHLFRACAQAGAQRARMIVKVAGGARAVVAEDRFQIGRRNMAMLRRLLHRNGVLVGAEDVGGDASRTMALDVASGTVIVTRNGIDTRL